jgi:outer membrane protein OmpA-like peptidoglycan-associated protein/tetratricopeptide (TPR) repeat protein
MLKRLIIVFLFLSGSSLYVSAQQSEVSADSIQLSEDFYAFAEEIMNNTKVVVQARDLYEQSANYDPNNIWANYMAGTTYLQTVNKERAVKFFKRVYELDPNFRFDLLYSIGRAYQYGMDFNQALNFYNQYRERIMGDVNYRGKDKVTLREVERRIEECNNGLEYVKNPKHHAIVTVSNKVNSEWPDYAPVLNEEETILIFTTRRQDGNLNENVDEDNFYFEDVFITEKKGGEWGYADNIGEPVNDIYHNSNLFLSADGNKLYLYRDDNNGDIYFSEKESDDSWSYPQPLNDNINSSFAEKSVSTSVDETLLFFSSDRPGGLGGLDIYMCRKNDEGEWGRSKNLGPIINTEFDEESPFIHYDGQTLYFSSRGRKGMGGYDIYTSTFDSVANEWAEPENIGYPVNTPDEDVFFVPTKDGRRGFFASVREDSQGYTDIYTVDFFPDDDEATPVAQIQQPTEPEPQEEPGEEPIETEPEPVKPAASMPVLLTIQVKDNTTDQPLSAKVNLRRVSDNQLAGKVDQGNGTYMFSTQYKQPTEMMLSVERDGYVFKNFKVTIPAANAQAQNISRTIELNPIQQGVSSVLRNIYFDFNKATFKKESYDELNKLERMLNENPGITVEIAGHTDKIGTPAYNKQLSQRRAEAVVNYVVSKGIPKNRIVARGYGETRPIASNDDEREGRELNRRVEFKVLSDGTASN